VRFWRETAKHLVIGTRWEGPIKRAHFTLTGEKNSLYDWQAIDIMRRVLRSDSVAIDIGAFQGGMLRHMFRFAPNGRHMAFEPLPRNCARLRAAFPNADVHECALGDHVAQVPFYEALDHPALSGLRRRAKDLPLERVREIHVPLETLDRCVPRELPIALVKVDVEGGELAVFRGGVETLRRNRPVVIFECGLGGADHFDADPRGIFDLIAVEIGLEISLLGSWLARRPSLSRDGFIDQFENRRNFYFVAHPPTD
jgi:FkbM family methyltransferase